MIIDLIKNCPKIVRKLNYVSDILIYLTFLAIPFLSSTLIFNVSINENLFKASVNILI